MTPLQTLLEAGHGAAGTPVIQGPDCLSTKPVLQLESLL